MTRADVRRHRAFATLGMIALGTATLALAVAMVAGLAAPASAQSTGIPEGQSCGGLVCDLGLFGHKTVSDKTAPEKTSPEKTSPEKTGLEPVPASRQADAPAATAPAAAPTRRHVASAKKKRVAKATAPVVPTSRAAVSAVVAASKPPLAQAPGEPTAARQLPAAQPAPSTQTSIGVPYIGPSSFSFRPIY